MDLAYLRAHPQHLPTFLTHQRIRETPVGGGDICAASRLTLDDGNSLFTKTWPETAGRAVPEGFFEAEAAGLRWLAEAGTVPVPEVIVALPDLLALEWIEPGARRPPRAERLGRELAALHRTGAPAFGAPWPGFIGALRRTTPRRPPRGRTGSPSIAWRRTCGCQPTRGALQRPMSRWSSGCCPRSTGTAAPNRRPGSTVTCGRATCCGQPTGGPGWSIPAAHGGHRETDLAQLALFGGAPHLDRDPRRHTRRSGRWPTAGAARRAAAPTAPAARTHGLVRCGVPGGGPRRRRCRARRNRRLNCRCPTRYRRAMTDSRTVRRVDGLLDRYGRVATDLRVSLTDRCNLRCTYCMPAEGLPWLPGPQVLTDDEVIRLVRVAVEPAGRDRGAVHRRRAADPPWPGQDRGGRRRLRARPTLSAHHQRHRARPARRPLRAAGLDRVNVSLDTLDAERFAALTRRRRLPDVLAGLAAADGAGLRPVKINTVLMRGINDDEAAGTAALRAGPRLRAAVHRADAAGRPARLGPGRDGHRRRDPHRAAGRLHPAAGPGRARRGAGRDVAGRRSTRARPASRPGSA